MNLSSLEKACSKWDKAFIQHSDLDRLIYQYTVRTHFKHLVSFLVIRFCCDVYCTNISLTKVIFGIVIKHHPIAWNFQWLVTLGTSKWPLTCVCYLMLLQMALLCEWLVTFGTMKWLLSCMGPLMIFHVSLLLAFSNSALVWIPCNTWSKDVAIHQSGSINVISNVLSVRMHCHILIRHTTFHQCGLSKSCVCKGVLS